MTRSRTSMLTAVAVALYVLLEWIFADGHFSGVLGEREGSIADAYWLTYVLIGAIVVAGLLQARSLPERGVVIDTDRNVAAGQTDDPRGWQLLLGNAYFSLLWIPVRFFVGREWLVAGERKVRDDGWMDGGAALQGYWERATTVPEGRPAAPAGTYGWFEDFLSYMLRNEWYTWFAKLIAVGEVLIGLGLIVGALVGVAAFFGTVMNFNFQLAGSASTNPVLFGLSVFLILAWKVAGYWGLDRWLLPLLGTPWSPGRLMDHDRDGSPTAQRPSAA